MANLFLVPHDFTAVGDAAFEHALFLATPIKARVKLIHIVSDKKKTHEALSKLEIVKDSFKDKNPDSLELEVMVKVGSIFDDIGKIADEENAHMVIMGTHGPKGMQKVFGSHAMKVVTSTSVPFLIVQEGVIPKKIENIIVPIDTSKESLQVISVASYISSIFDSKIFIVAEKESDLRLSQQLKIRISLVKKEYQEKNINSEVVFLEKGKPFQKKIREFALENNVQLIAFAYHSSSLLPQFDGYAQSLISNNEQIPCIMVNAKLLSKLYY